MKNSAYQDLLSLYNVHLRGGKFKAMFYHLIIMTNEDSNFNLTLSYIASKRAQGVQQLVPLWKDLSFFISGRIL